MDALCLAPQATSAQLITLRVSVATRTAVLTSGVHFRARDAERRKPRAKDTHGCFGPFPQCCCGACDPTLCRVLVPPGPALRFESQKPLVFLEGSPPNKRDHQNTRGHFTERERARWHLFSELPSRGNPKCVQLSRTVASFSESEGPRGPSFFFFGGTWSLGTFQSLTGLTRTKAAGSMMAWSRRA